MAGAQMPQTGDARRVALGLLWQVLEEGRLLSDLGTAPALQALAPADRAAAQRLASDTLRGLPRADAMLTPHLRKAPPMAIRNILRLAVVELAHGGAAHGVVNAAVAAAGAGKRTRTLAGLVNAVLRKIAPTAVETWARLPIPKLPPWLRGPLVAAWGRPGVAAMEAVHFAGAPLDLTARGDPAELAAAVGGTLLPTGSVRLPAGGQVTALPGFAEGRFWVQDAAAALPVQLLGDVSGQSVLDMCAAPGGKTMQLAARGARVTALDLSEARLARVRENLDRTGLDAVLLKADAETHAGGPYDAILLDAPCSATGTIRRHPDLPHARTGEGISELIALQARLIDRALALLAPGGALVYCTCSLIPDEGEVQIEEACARHPGLVADAPLPAGVPEIWRSEDGGLRLRPDHWPDAGGMDGFYTVRLKLRKG